MLVRHRNEGLSAAGHCGVQLKLNRCVADRADNTS
jgi:hypothetical protein